MIKRRQLLQISAGLLIGQALGLRAEASASPTLRLIQRAIPSSGELLPVMGMGTSRTFDTEGDPASLATLQEVLQAFFDGGGTVIDSSPMYGNSESRVGAALGPDRGGYGQAVVPRRVWLCRDGAVAGSDPNGPSGDQRRLC